MTAALYLTLVLLCVGLGLQMKTVRPFGSLVVGILFQALQIGSLVFVAALIGGQS